MGKIQNGIYLDSEGKPAHRGIVEYDGKLYYAGKDGVIVKKARKTIHHGMANGLVRHGSYYFDEDGVIDLSSYKEKKEKKKKPKKEKLNRNSRITKKAITCISALFLLVCAIIIISAIDGVERSKGELISKGETIEDERNDGNEEGENFDDLRRGVTVPDYWLSELATKADAIQTAMEKAGRNKSAFLWYTDAHWANGNSKVSPALLDYLYMNTPMNKVNFGGDIIGDSLLSTRDEMKYLYEWRKAIKNLPNHHSVEGNHDVFESDAVDYEGTDYTYAVLLATEESTDMVMGDGGNYYYIDNPAEKTRYLYFANITSNQTAMLAQGQFMVDALESVPDGWHIVAIKHRWWQYSRPSTPTTGSIPAYETEILSIFDAYNARETRGGSNYFNAQDFTDAKGKVEFCIGGHIHIDHDLRTDGGIPIIITTSNANQDRVPDSVVDCGTIGTITEAAVYGIIADYEENIVTVVGVGRGASRVIPIES